jgi:hypothetical protein
MSSRLSRLSPVVVLVAGIAVLVAAGLWAARESAYDREGVRTIGTIVAAEERPAGFSDDEHAGSQPRWTYHVQYSYQDTAGRFHLGQTDTSWDGYAPDQRVVVQFREAAPEQSRILTTGAAVGAWLWIALLCGVGVCLVIDGVGRVLAAARGRKVTAGGTEG